MFSRIKKSKQNHAKRRKSNAKRQKRRRNGKQKPERYIAAPVYAFTRRWGTALGDGLGSAPRSAKRPNARAARRLQTPPPRLTAHARGAERAPRIFRKGHDCPLLWMKLPPMVGTRRRFYKNENSRKRGERGVGKRQRWRSCCTYSHLYVYTRDGPHVTPRLTRGPDTVLKVKYKCKASHCLSTASP